MCSCQTLHGVGMVTRRSNNLNQDRYGGPLKKAWQSHVRYDLLLQINAKRLVLYSFDVEVCFYTLTLIAKWRV